MGIMNMRMVAADTTTGKAADTITMVTRMVAASTMRKVAAVKAADITMIKLVFFE
ncbi:hypothetical protein IV60_GL000221 [Lancefieldella rimae]|uniref:Uncharacterized protein n=2 Tax=Lancefieldella rimae TaxID=1383 RepID=B9CKR2_LANR4|nr:hypothetical protein ATORI0001_0621 [Lancefieldella rimae ATCC 49626]KRO03044.1 hypothetical protein IV60_GL000221 [Lancefieldella rimae]